MCSITIAPMASNRNRAPYSTRWDGAEILVLDDEKVIDRIPASEIRRVILVSERSDAPTDLSFAVIETTSDHVLLPAETGIAGRVHFERQSFWAERPCVYWVAAARAVLPRHLLPGVWLLRRHRPGYMRVPRAELAATLENWPLEGPQSWEQRKWARIVANRGLPPPGERAPK